MMSFSLVKSATTGADYYSGKDNYYVLGSLKTRWEGKGAQALCLTGPVDNAQLTRILHGQLPDGSSLSRVSGGRETHRPGYDLTFSAPKSVSVMALVAGDRRLLTAHDTAVSAALREAETLACARVTHNGMTSIKRTGNFMAAVFTHDTSRDLDPQLHSHAVIANATRTEQGWRALASDRHTRSGFSEAVLANQLALGNIYLRTLRQEVEALGYTTRHAGRNGLWEMTDVPVDPFAQRRQAIEKAVGPEASPKSRAVAALDTRRAKAAVDPLTLLADWTLRLKEAGFSPRAYRQAADMRAQEEKDKPAIPAPAFCAAAREAVNRAISVLSDNAVRFTYSDLLAKSATQLEAAPGIFDAVRTGIEEAIKQDQLIPLDKEKGVFTSGIHLLNELSARSLVQDIGQEGPAAIREKEAIRYTQPWSDAVTVMRQDRPRLAIVECRGGADVTLSRLREVAAMAQDMGRPVTVLAADRRSEKWLSEKGMGEVAVLSGRDLLTQQNAMPEQSTVIVEQAESLSLSQTLTLLNTAQRQSMQVIFMNTGRRQGTGCALDILKDAGMSRYRMKDGSQAQISLICEPDKRARFARLAEEYVRRTEAGEEITAQISGPREQKALTAAIRGAMTDRGLLGEAHTLEALTPVWLTAKTRCLRDNYREGMVMEQWGAEAKRMTRWVVRRVGEQTHTLTLDHAEGARQTLKIREIDASWNLYRKEFLSVAPGDRLKVTAREARGQLTGGDQVQVVAVTKETLTVRAGEKTITLDASQALKLGHDYVHAPGSSVSATAHVLAMASRASLSCEGMNQLTRSGKSVSLYTALEEARARSLLRESLQPCTPLAEVGQHAGVADPQLAIKARQKTLNTPVQSAVRQGAAVAESAHRSGITFSSIQLLEAAWSAADGVSPDALRQEIQRQVRTGELLYLDVAPGAGISMMVRRSSYEMERSIVRHIAEGKGAVRPLMDRVPEKVMAGLTLGQRAASALILQSPDRFIAIQGYAGVGKTTQMRAVLNALNTLPEATRPEVIGLGPTHRAVHEMQAAGVKAQTLASFLADERQRGQGGDGNRYAGRLFLVDESSMTGNRDMAELYRIIAAGGGRAVMSGDSAQLKSPEPGIPFTMQQRRSAVDIAVMKDIVRQTSALKPVIYSMIEGAYRRALDQAEQITPDQVPRRPDAWVPAASVVEFPAKGPSETAASLTQRKVPLDVTDAMALDYAGRTPEAQHHTLVITQTNQDRDVVNAKIHDLRHAAGDTGLEEYHISALSRVNTQQTALRIPETWTQYTGRQAFMDDAFWLIRDTHLSQGIVTLEGVNGEVRLLSVRENSAKDISIWENKTIVVSQGDRLRFAATDTERGYVANSTWTLERVDAQSRLHLCSGDATRVLDPVHDLYDRRIDLAYAVTTHGSQGASERFSISLQGVTGRRGSLASQENSYVQLSRAKEHAQVYTDDREAWSQRMARAADRLSAHDVLEADADRHIQTGVTLYKRATPAADNGLGRRILSDAGIKGEFMGRIIGGFARYPVPQVALPLFDVNGKAAGAVISDIRQTAGQYSAGGTLRRAGNESGSFAGFQRSRDGCAVIADSWAEAEKVARENPMTGVLLRLSGTGQPWNIKRILGGEPQPVPRAEKTKPEHLIFSEKLHHQAELKRQAEEHKARQAMVTVGSKMSFAIRDNKRDQAAIEKIAHRNHSGEHLPCIDREIIRDRSYEK